MNYCKVRQSYRSRLLPALLALTATLLPSDYLAADTISFVSNPWPPYYIDSQPISGIMPDIITAAYAQQGKYQVSFHVRPWKRALFEVKEGTLDAVTSAYYHPERAKHYLYSEAILSSSIMVYKLKKFPLPGWNTLNDLKGFRIGVEREHIYSPEFNSAEFLQKEEATTEVLNFNKLLMGRIDLMPMDQLVARYYLAKDFTDQADQITTVGPPLNSSSTIHLIFSKKVKNSQEMLDAFHSGLKKIKENGIFQQILDSYLSNGQRQEAPEKSRIR